MWKSNPQNTLVDLDEDSCWQKYLFKLAKPGLFLFIFVLLSTEWQIFDYERVDGELGIRTWAHRMVGENEYTFHPIDKDYIKSKKRPG